MAQPLITGEPRVTHGPARAHPENRRSRKPYTRGAPIRHRSQRSYPSAIAENRADRTQPQQSSGPKKKGGGVVSKIKAIPKKLARTGLAGAKAVFLSSIIVWIYPAQILLAFFFLLGYIYATSSGFLAENNVLWGADIARGVMLTVWVVNAALGIGLLIFSSFIYFMSGTRAWRHPFAVLTFAVCVWGYLAINPITMFIPWVLLWIWVVVMVQLHK